MSSGQELSGETVFESGFEFEWAPLVAFGLAFDIVVTVPTSIPLASLSPITISMKSVSVCIDGPEFGSF